MECDAAANRPTSMLLPQSVIHACHAKCAADNALESPDDLITTPSRRKRMDPNKATRRHGTYHDPELAQAFIDEQVAAIREQVGDGKVLLAFRRRR